MLIGLICLSAICSCAFNRSPMDAYYRNHPEMRRRLIQVRSIYISESVDGANDGEEAAKVRECLLDELTRKGRGRFRLAPNPSSADAVLESGLKQNLGPLSAEEPLPFTLEPQSPSSAAVYLKLMLRDPATGRLIYSTDTAEDADIEIDTIEKAAHLVVRNLMRAIYRAG